MPDATEPTSTATDELAEATIEVTSGEDGWPRLRVADWAATRDTLHMWTQIVGKIRMTHAPLVNHWWQVPLYVSARGLTTSSVPYGHQAFDIELDFCEHQLRIRASGGATRTVALEAKPVADFYAETIQALDELGIEATISDTPNEVDPAVPFATDRKHASYDRDAVHLFWRQLLQADRVLHEFRSDFLGKVSPVHFFWGSFDLACTRFSGRTAPAHPGGAPNVGDWVMVEGYSHELSSCGFWPGGGDEGAFYAYAYPAPEGFADYPVGPDAAYYNEQHHQFLLPYEAVRTAPDPDQVVRTFLQSSYEAAAELGNWDRDALEGDPARWADRR